jgi:hypothetical protein
VGQLIGEIGVLPTSAGAIVTLVCLLIIFGIIPSPGQYRDVKADRDKWRESAEKWQATATQLGMSMEKLLVYAETTNHAMVDIRELAQRRTSEAERSQ